MGSATVEKSHPQVAMATNDKKTLTKIFKEVKGFFTKDKKKERKNDNGNEENSNKTQTTADPVETHKTKSTGDAIEQPKPKTAVEAVLENFRKLELEKRENKKNEELKKLKESENDDELKYFSYKVVEDSRSERIDSHSSEDSGFSEKIIEVKEKEESEKEESDTEKDELSESLADLKIEEGKKKRWQTVFVARTPIRKKTDYSATVRPYPSDALRPGTSVDVSPRQIHQVNRQFLSGGQVIDTQNTLRTTEGDYSHVVDALLQVEKTKKNAEHEEGFEWLLSSLDDIIQKDITKIQIDDIIEKEMNTDVNLLDEFNEINKVYENIEHIDPNFTYESIQNETSNPIEEFTNHNHLNAENDIVDVSSDVITQIQNELFYYPTPPYSENMSSPLSDSQTSFRPNSEYTLSPERSSPICNSDNEVFQDINPEIDEYPVFVSNTEVKKRDRVSTSNSKWHLKQYKDLQKEISNSFSKKECCKTDRKCCKQIYHEHLEKLKKEEKMNLCYKVSNLNLKDAYGVLHHIMLSLSQGSELEDFQQALFALICEKILAQIPAVFVGQFGLNLLKASALRCYRRPLFTRSLVQCIRTAIANEPSLVENKDCVFHEVDIQGDTLLHACARVGDTRAEVLSELVRKTEGQLPLFRLHHVNADGLSALHVACSEHSPATPRLHTVHVLLEHAAADIWMGDKKSDDNALHLAVKSKSCDLNLVMLLFKHVDRKLWKKLAHKQNMCLKSPLEYAREAARSPVTENRPLEVLEFLRKCRN